MAYAAVHILLQNLDRLLQPNSYLILHKKEQVECLLEKVKFLQGFLEGSEKERCHQESIKHLEWEIRDVSYNAGDIIDSKIRNIHVAKSAKNRKKAYRNLRRSLQQVTEEIDSIKIKLLKINKGRKKAIKALETRVVDGSPQHMPDMENLVVGLEDDLQIIKDRLTQFPLKLETIPIVGMGGVGKTTLARKLYEDPSIVFHFHVRSWVTVSQDYRVRILLLDLCQLHNDNKISNEDLAERLHKNLKGRRYLIVLDDIWSTEAWDAVKGIFPDDRNGSRIILTSRLYEVAIYANPEKPHHMDLLNSVDSWKLLHEKLFGDQRCPPELEDIGKKIAAKCRGLPLALVVIAGYLLKINRSRECWENVADNVSSYVTEDSQQCLDIIALSYNQLPHHLKACFLYFAAFSEDFHIPVSKLILLWIAEGFLKKVESKTLEEVAEECLEDLIERNLILIGKWNYGGIKTCLIHDILRDFCLREAQKENFLHIMNHRGPDFCKGKSNPRRLSFHPDRSFLYVPISYIGHLLSISNFSRSFPFRHTELKLLRVLDIMLSPFFQFPIQILQLANLRFLALSIGDELPSSISKLWNLQTLVLHCSSGGPNLPEGIWKMPQLRHLYFTSCSFLPDPDEAENDENGYLILHNLQTLSKLSLSCGTMQVFARLPNLKKLGLYETAEPHITEKRWLHRVFPSDKLFNSIYSVEHMWCNIGNVARLHQLQTLKLNFTSLFAEERRWVPRVDEFPPNLKKLTLRFSYLPWEYMDILSMLPNLEVLKLKDYAFMGSEWNQCQEGFERLKYLVLHKTDLLQWKATSTQFPSLEHLVLRDCRCLIEVPLDFAEIPSLERIDVYNSPSAAMSVTQIQKEQESMGNDELFVHINPKF